MRAVIHVNPSSEWQVRYAAALLAGLRACGNTPRITHNPVDADELTVVLGPHWALSYHGHRRVVLIDRAYWGDPQSVSMHWAENGQKVFDWSRTEPRDHPPLSPLKTGSRTVVLCDYGRLYELGGATIRRHPADAPSCETLAECLARHEIAAGGRSTALVDAAIAGLRVVTNDKHSPVLPLSFQAEPDRERWITALAWHNWNINEIEQGEPWRVMGI